MSIKYKEIASKLRQQIIATKSLVSYKLPTEKELCLTYGVSRQTIRQALEELTKEGLICSRQGSGTFTIPSATGLEAKVVFLLPEENEYLYPAFISSIKKELSKEGITPLIHFSHNDYNEERRILSSFLKQPPVVFVIEGVRDAFYNPNLDLYEKLLDQNVSFIFINSSYSLLPRCLHISSDDYKGGYKLGEHLISCGLYQVSGILPDFASNAKTRYQGMLAAYRDHSLPMPATEIFWYNHEDLTLLRTKQNTHFLHSFVRNHHQKENAVFCYNDEIAYWLLKEFRAAHISVPEEVSVVSFDNSYLSRISTPLLTSLALPDNAFETELTEMLKMLLSHHSSMGFSYQSAVSLSAKERTLPWKLISRNSVSIP